MIRRTIASCLILALAVILGLHLAYFSTNGGVYIYEDNRVILAIEWVMTVGIFGFGIMRLWNTFR